MDALLEKELRKLVKNLRRQASVEYKKVKNDATHYEGMCKGMYLGYEEAANRLLRIISDHKKKESKVSLLTEKDIVFLDSAKESYGTVFFSRVMSWDSAYTSKYISEAKSQLQAILKGYPEIVSKEFHEAMYYRFYNLVKTIRLLRHFNKGEYTW